MLPKAHLTSHYRMSGLRWVWVITPSWLSGSWRSFLYSSEYSLEGMMMKLKFQYFGHLMQRADSLEKTLIWKRLKVGGAVDDRGWDGWMASPTRWTWVWVNSRSWWWTGKPGVLQSMGSQRVRHDWVTELNWTLMQWRQKCNIRPMSQLFASGGQSIGISASS